jgi:hypothetical protein
MKTTDGKMPWQKKKETTTAPTRDADDIVAQGYARLDALRKSEGQAAALLEGLLERIDELQCTIENACDDINLISTEYSKFNSARIVGYDAKRVDRLSTQYLEDGYMGVRWRRLKESDPYNCPALAVIRKEDGSGYAYFFGFMDDDEGGDIVIWMPDNSLITTKRKNVWTFDGHMEGASE